MNSRFRSLSLTACALSALAFASGCEVSKCKTPEGQDATCAESLEVYTGVPETQTLPYASGQSLVVTSVKGDIHVDQGNAGEVSVTFEPFTYRGHSKDADAADEINNKLNKEFTDDGATLTVITSTQEGASDELGATLKILLPPEFDGAITTTAQGYGNIEEADIAINFVGSATSADITSSHGLGDCDLDGAPTIVSTVAHCKGLIEITNVSDNVTAVSTGPFSDDTQANVRVVLAGIADGATGGSMTSEKGRIELGFPLTGNYTIAAQANSEGVVNEGTLPDGCTVTGEGNSKTVACGTGGANYSVQAGTDEAFDPANVDIGYL